MLQPKLEVRPTSVDGFKYIRFVNHLHTGDMNLGKPGHSGNKYSFSVQKSQSVLSGEPIQCSDMF